MGWTTPTDRSTGYVVTAADWNVIEDNLTFLYGDTAWTTPTFTNSWVDYATGTIGVGFRKIGTRVSLRGAIKSGTIGTSAFTLPTGYRPPAQTLNIATVSNSAFGYVAISSGGSVTPTVGSNVWFSLDGITFDTV